MLFVVLMDSLVKNSISIFSLYLLRICCMKQNLFRTFVAVKQ